MSDIRQTSYVMVIIMVIIGMNAFEPVRFGLSVFFLHNILMLEWGNALSSAI